MCIALFLPPVSDGFKFVVEPRKGGGCGGGDLGGFEVRCGSIGIRGASRVWWAWSCEFGRFGRGLFEHFGLEAWEQE